MKYEAERQYQEYRAAAANRPEDVLADPGSEDNPRRALVKVREAAGPDRPALYKMHEARHGRLAEVSKATAGWDENRGKTWPQRRKEEASDYRYFPEPDLVPVVVDEVLLNKTRAEMGELPAQARKRLREQYGLSPYDAGVLTAQGRGVVAYFEETARGCNDAKAACNWVTNQVLASLKEQTIDDVGMFKLRPAALAELIAEQKATGMSRQTAGAVYARMLETGAGAREATAQLGLKAVGAADLQEVVRRAISNNPKAVADFKKGKAAAANAIKGAVMRETRGTANPEVVQQILLEELQKA
jgi:aspartyl-tRNA(Asn)/glutamyl-tRNA(Gln) amidotransferase subunit B